MHLCLKVLLPFALAAVLIASIQAAFTKPAPPLEPASSAVVVTESMDGEDGAAEAHDAARGQALQEEEAPEG